MTFLVLLFAHLVADYPLQGDFLANFKGKNWLLLASHCGIWTGCVALAAYFCGIAVTPAAVASLFCIHLVADQIKSRKLLWCKNLEPLGAALWIDQLIHVGQLVFLAYL